MTKIVTSAPIALHFFGIEPDRSSPAFELGDLLAARRLRDPQCTPAGGRIARIELVYFKVQGAFTRVAFGLRFCWPFQWESCDSRFFYHPQGC